MTKLSTGQDSTLGNYLALANIFFGENSGAVRFIEGKIKHSSNGANEEVIAAESQMIYLLHSLNETI